MKRVSVTLLLSADISMYFLPPTVKKRDVYKRQQYTNCTGCPNVNENILVYRNLPKGAHIQMCIRDRKGTGQQVQEVRIV